MTGTDVKVLRLADESVAAEGRASDAGALAIIPARGGSKRVPRKNLAMAGGKPLLAWAILAAQKAKRVGRVLVSTDDLEIADVARSCGVEVPWLRPTVLARDDSPTLDVIVHAMQWALENLKPAPKFAVLLEPTAPLRTAQQIDAAIELLASSDADSVVSVSEVPHVLNPEELVAIDQGQLLPFNPSRTMDTPRLRGQQPPVYVRNGLVYGLRIASVLANKRLYGSKTVPLIIGWEYFLDVDTANDLQWADHQLRTLPRTDQSRL
jgi:CMP-N-acetylneuraminic acid synthetase